MVKAQGDLNQIFKYLDVPGNSAILKLRDALQIVLSERDSDMDGRNTDRIELYIPLVRS